MPNYDTRCRVNGAAPNNTNPYPLLYVTATGADAVSTLTGTTGKCWCIGKFGILFSYAAGTFTQGTLKFETSPDNVSYTQRLSVDVTVAGLGPVPFHKPVKFPLGEYLRITLTNGGTSVVGKLIIADYWLEGNDDPSA